MRSNFLQKFVDIVNEIGSFTGDLLVYESLPSKDLRMGGIDPKKFYSGVKNLERRQILEHVPGGYCFTPQGKSWLQNARLKYFRSISKKWDNKWRIILFDIPQELHNQRSIFRRRLQYLGLSMLQKSVFVYPYNCELEIAAIAEKLGVNDYVDIIVADSIGFKEAILREQYGL